MALSIDPASQILLPRKCAKTVAGRGDGVQGGPDKQGWGMRRKMGPSWAEPRPRVFPSATPRPLSSCGLHGQPWKHAARLSLDTGLSHEPSHTGWNFPTQPVLNPKARRDGGKKMSMKKSGETNTKPRPPVVLTTDWDLTLQQPRHTFLRTDFPR